jgi:hypothetical protein
MAEAEEKRTHNSLLAYRYHRLSTTYEAIGWYLNTSNGHACRGYRPRYGPRFGPSSYTAFSPCRRKGELRLSGGPAFILIPMA